MMQKKHLLLFFFLIKLIASEAKEHSFNLVSSEHQVTILCDENAHATVQLSAQLLARDIYRITGVLPEIKSSLKKVSGNVILIGEFEQSALIESLHPKSMLDHAAIEGQWEVYQYKVLTDISKKISSALIIVGSDARGTAYGVLDISQKIGVSPWVYWADVKPQPKNELTINVNDFTSKPPSVKYRGIFINDEDWGLQPWAAKTLEPETGDIGPKTYAHVFELLLRLKANLIWPAMHPCTKAFFSYPQNIKVAEKYGIVVGSSHCEQMLCNNVDEWNKEVNGPFNYFTNRHEINKYWENRVKESSSIDGIYTLGLRGVHDSGIVGASSMSEKVNAVKEVIDEQREMLKNHISENMDEVPQVLIPYKEVLDIYDQGLDLPEDITVIWPDDNYGYIRRLSCEEDQQRKGGGGIYYHASYWGRPHDYLWLSTTNPWLIHEEMHKAYEHGAKNVWVLNVGDIKPLEYNIDLFLSMAWDMTSFSEGVGVQNHMRHWYGDIFGTQRGEEMAQIMKNYYQLAYERRPEFMGWSRTEPTTQVHLTSYNHFLHNDEAQQRLNKYTQLEERVKALYGGIKEDSLKFTSFYQLVYYPVMMSVNMNRKYLYRDKAIIYANQGRLCAHEYVQLSRQAHQYIQAETKWFNTELSDGKWNHIMSGQPRHLPVFKEPVIDIQPVFQGDWSIRVETSTSHTATKNELPMFYPWYKGSYFIDLFLTNKKTVQWEITSKPDWLIVSENNGSLKDMDGQRELRLQFTVDWDKVSTNDVLHNQVSIVGNGREVNVNVRAYDYQNPAFTQFQGALENNGSVSIFAEHYTRVMDQKNSKWKKMEGLGHSGASMQYMVNHAPQGTKSTQESSVLKYDFYVLNSDTAKLDLFALPTHPLYRNGELKVAVELDGVDLGEVNFRTHGRSNKWKDNVLSNTAIESMDIGYLSEGIHTLIIKGRDEGVILDRLLIKLGNNTVSGYAVTPEYIK